MCHLALPGNPLRTGIFMDITHDDDDDIKEVSSVDKSPMVLEKYQWVGQNVAQHVTQSTSKVSKVATLDAAKQDLIQSCLGKPITLTDAKDSPVKTTMKQKKKHSVKDRDQSWDWRCKMSSESDSVACRPMQNPAEARPEGSSEIQDAIKKQAIIESKHQRCHASDYFFIHDICNQLGLPSKEVNQDDMSGYLTKINEKWKEWWHEADWCKSYIWSVEGTLAVLWQTIQSPDKDLSPGLKTNLKNVIVQLPPMLTSISKGSSKTSGGSWLSGSDVQSSGVGQAIAHSVPSVRQPTGTGLSAAWASTSQTQLTPALSQGYSYSHTRGQPISRGSLPVLIEAMSFRAPPSQPYNLYSSLPQTSTWSSQELTPSGVPISRPVHLMTPVPSLHSQDQGSTMAPIFQQHAPAKWQHVPSSTAWQPIEDRDIIFMDITHDDDDDIKEVSSVHKSPMVLEKRQWVGQNVAQHVTQSTSKVGEVAALDAAELGLIQSCLGKPVTLMDAEDSPVNTAMQQKKKCSMKEQDQSWDWWCKMSSDSDSTACCPTQNPAEAQPEGSSEIQDAIKKQAIIESEHQRWRAADYFFIHDICNQLGLPSKEVNQDDMSGYLTKINEKQKEQWHEADWCKSYIWSVEGTLAVLWQTVQYPDKDLSPSLKTNLKNVIVQLEECQYRRTMPVASDLKGTVDRPFIKYVARVFVDNKGNPLNALTGDTGSRVMLGLLWLHTKDAIQWHQKSNIDMKTICPFCTLSVGNHESANNQVRAHWHLGLMHGKCFRVELTCEGMVAHTKEAHHFDLK